MIDEERTSVRKFGTGRAPRFNCGDLRLFSEPLAWPQIVEAFRGVMKLSELRDAVMDADEHGTGSLRWCKKTRAWRLSARGRELLSMRRTR